MLRHVIELVAGVVLMSVAIALWMGRSGLARRNLPGRSGAGRSAIVAGASIAAIELLSAAPYLAIIGGIVASSASLSQQIVLLTLYNLTVVLPLLAILAVLLLAADRANPLLARAGAWVQLRWPVVLSSLLIFGGGVLAVLGGSGLVKQ